MTPPFSKELTQLNHEDHSVRIRALRELGHLKAAECLMDIIGVIEKDPNDKVKVEDVRALGHIQEIPTSNGSQTSGHLCFGGSSNTCGLGSTRQSVSSLLRWLNSRN